MHVVAVLALPGVVPFDLATPLEVFARVSLEDGANPYEVRVCAASATVEAGAFTIRAPWGLDALDDADTIILPGCADVTTPIAPEVIASLRGAAERGVRIASICSGAFILAATGLLDGLRATTHWVAAELLARWYPQITVDPEVLYIDHGHLATSAGAAAGLDLCLHLIRRDYGSAAATMAAKLSVVPLEREGGQAQFIVHEQPPVPRGATMEPLLRWLEESVAEDLTTRKIAAHAGMSIRTLNRRFREQTGTTPLQWLHRARVRRAQYLLESTAVTVDRIGGQVGFGSPTAFRDCFKRVVGTSPQAYRQAFRSAPAEASGDHRPTPELDRRAARRVR
ncbi:GlxA family transcriptional regulator [Dactylosporangium sp. NPDC051541]|uniref:GlxA family transcriptional regulator n=1 Tax=Dactylosporangium sp. NPDC051541 TaxID=3363977 RepID=UPI003787E8AA